MQGEKLFALEEWVELANGCLCCSLKDDFLRALEALMEQRQRFDYIIVETTGAWPTIPYASVKPTACGLIHKVVQAALYALGQPLDPS